MVEIIAGQKGKGKTKYLLEKANNAIKDAKGSIVYLDKSSKHMYELNTRVRLINVADFGIGSYEAFIGFICGIISQDHDLEQMYLDSFLKLSWLEGQDIAEAIDELDRIGKKYEVTFVLSVSRDAADLPENAKDKIVVSSNLTAQEEAVPNRFKFTGQQLDPVTQQYYLRARFYNPVIARFTQEDTYRGDGLNLYAYCANNPVLYVDPLGNRRTQICVNKEAHNLISEGVPTEIAYRKAHANLLTKQLNDPDLSPAERQRILDKLAKTTDMSRISDSTLKEAAQSIHEAQYERMPGIGAVNPISVTIGSDGSVAVTKNNSVIGKKSREQARLIFGDDVIIPKGYGVQYDNIHNPISTPRPKHAEARGYQAILTYGGESSLSGARQATTLPSCEYCQDLRNNWNEHLNFIGKKGITNLTGDRC